MKRFLSIVLAIFMIISNACVVFANEDVELYAYTSDTTGYDEYASKKFEGFVYGHYGYVDSTLELGKGITIINENDFPKVLYPVWENNEIVATFIVVNVDGEYSGTYSDIFVDQLNIFKELCDEKNPLIIFVNQGTYAKIGEDVYSLDDMEIKGEIKLDIEYNDDNVVNAFEKNDHENIQIPRYPTTKALSWTIGSYLQPYYTEEYDGDVPNGFCASYCLYYLLRNQGITSYSLQTIKNNVHYYGVTISYMQTFLNNNGFTYSSSSSGYLDKTAVANTIYSDSKYILIFTARINYSDALDDLGYFGHAMVLTGYSFTNLANTYKVFDPVFSTQKTMDADTRIVSSDENFTFRWSGGYVYRITK